MKTVEKLLILLSFLFLTGCTTMQKSTALDGLTTYAALAKSPTNKEANPILAALSDDPLGVAVGSVFLTYGVLKFGKMLGEDNCRKIYRGVTNMKIGAGINNLSVIAGMTGWGSLAMGAGAFIWAKKHLNLEEEIEKYCTPNMHRSQNEGLAQEG